MTGRRPRGRPGRFGWALAGVVVVAFVVRLAFGLLVAPDLPPASDSEFYRDVAHRLADGQGFSTQGRFLAFVPAEEVVPTAKHPPAFPLVLAVADGLGLDSWGAQRAYLAGLAAVGVGLLGVAGRLLVDGRVGLVAAAIAAVHPLWFQHAGMVVSEAFYLPVLAGLLAAAAVALRRPGPGSFALVGLAIGLAVLTRVEALLLVPLVAAPVAWLVPAGRQRWAWCMPVVVLVVVVPWVVRNEVVMGAPVVSLNGGATMLGANCDTTYAGEGLGGFDVWCGYGGVAVAAELAGRGDRAAVDLVAQDLAIEYARDRADRLPVVAAARVGRTLGVFQLGHGLDFDTAEGRHRPTQRVGHLVNLVVLVLSVAGALILRRRRLTAPLVVLAGLVLAGVATGAAIYGSTRMRATAEPALVVLAAVAVVHGLDRRRPARPGGPAGGEDRRQVRGST